MTELDDNALVAICQHTMLLLKKSFKQELARAITREICLVDDLCRQTLANETDIDEPVVVLIPSSVRRECVIAVWWYLKKIGYDVRIEDQLGPNGEAQLVFGFYLEDVVKRDAFEPCHVCHELK